MRGSCLQRNAVDLAVAIDGAAALALGWCLASVLTGVCRESWFALTAEEHSSSALGVKGVLENWLVGFPIGEAMKALALFGVAAGGWTSQLMGADDAALASATALDGAGLLLALTLWRRFLLGWFGVR